MRIILNADDFGSANDTVQATIACFEAGALTSASLMARMPASAQALSYAASHKEHSFGVHLTFVSDGVERPLCDPAEVPALLQADGQFMPSNRARVLGMLRRLPVAQIAREMTAQLAFVRDHGVAISHVDSHGHTHKFASFRAALREVLPRFGVRRVRTVQDLYLRPPLKSPTYWLGGYWRRALLWGSGYATTDHFYMPTSAGDGDWTEALLARVGALPGATLEVGVHPGTEEPWRDRERAAILRFAAAARARGHSLIGWRELG